MNEEGAFVLCYGNSGELLKYNETEASYEDPYVYYNNYGDKWYFDNSGAQYILDSTGNEAIFYEDGSYSFINNNRTSSPNTKAKYYDANGNGAIYGVDDSIEYVYSDTTGNMWGYDTNGNAFYKNV